MTGRRVLAAFVRSGGGVELRDVGVPSPGAGEVLISMKASGVCGTDLEKIMGRGITSSILGHEVSGVISESNLQEFKVGDHVIPHHHVACGNCELCRAGAETMCNGFKTSNFVPCGFATEFLVPSYNVMHGGIHRISDRLSFEEASFAEPLGCCIRGLDRAGVLSKQARKVLVVGSGPIGLLHMDLIRFRIPEAIICAVDVLDTRLDFAEKNEGAIPVDATRSLDGGFSVEALKHTKGSGFDLVIVATGTERAFTESLKCVRRSGTVLLFGAPHKGSTHKLALDEFFISEHTMISSYSTTEKELEQAIQLLESKKINVGKFITSRFPLSRIEEAMTAAREPDQVKTIVTE